jgi:uncharacterized protein (DUF362 family)
MRGGAGMKKEVEEVVVIESGKGRSKFDLLDAALEEVDFPALLEDVRRDTGKPKDKFVVLVKPNLAMFFKDVVTITDPELVEYLVDILHDLEYTNVILGEAQNAFSKWLKNREIPNIAKAAGYKFKTPKGREYDFVDLSKGEMGGDFPAEYSHSDLSRQISFHAPGDHPVRHANISKYWVEADFRISFAKNKTHEQYYYTLCLKNLLGALPKWNKHLDYHSRLKVFDVCLELHRQYPAHFNIIDAYVSSHRNAGAQMAKPIKTETIIAGANAILVDWVGALKMGLDPYLSPLNKNALDLVKLPDKYQVIGSLARYEGWRNVHPLIADSFLRLDEAEPLRKFLWPGSFRNDSQMFPWKKKIPWLVNKLMAWPWEHTDGIIVLSFVLRWLFILFNYSAVLYYFIKTVWKVLFLKKKVMQKVLPINLPEDKFRDEDYEKLPEAMKPLEELAEALPRNSRSSHTFVDDAILYCHEREVDYPFDDFVSKVDICRAVTTMKDYVGGRTIQKTFDKNGRCIHQLERTVFLPQPNLLVLANGKDIDVTKIEKIAYGTSFQKLFWKTVLSDNHTGVYDEGTVTFEQHNFKTRIRIMAHQKFLFPWALKWARMDLWPGLRRFIMLRIYRGFFEKTIDNYCVLAEGKYEPIGEPWKTSTEDP